MSALLAGRLSALRTQRGFSQRQIANYIGISSQSCSHYETGQRTPDIFTLHRLAEFYHVPMEYLLCPEKADPSQPLSQSIRTLSNSDLAYLGVYLDFLASKRRNQS